MELKKGGSANNLINLESPEIVLSPRTRKAGEKLLSARKTKRLQKEFKKTQRALNTRSHRMRNSLKINPRDLLGNHFKFFINPNLIDETTKITLSTPQDSGSGSVVMLFKSKKTDHQYVLKVTGLKKKVVVNPGRPMNFPELECEIYKEVTKLVRKNITPHTFTILNSSLNIRRTTIPANNYFFMEGLNVIVPYLSVMLNETSSANSKLKTLSKFIKENLLSYSEEDMLKIMYNILFQIMYTLDVFNRVGIMHNDLHTGNIFIVIKNNSFDQANYRKTFRKYRFKSNDGTQCEINLENIGFDVRIYDYDRSYKFAKPETKFPQSISTPNMQVFESINEYHTYQNPYFDTFKILCHLYHHYMAVLPIDFMDRIIDKYFIESDLLIKGVVGNKDFLMSHRIYYELKEGNLLKATRLREYFLINSIPAGHMMTTEEILLDLVSDPTIKEHISGTEAQVPVIETYDMDGINKDLLESDKKKAIVKEFKKKPANRITRRLSTGGPIRRRKTTRRQSAPHIEYKIKKKRKGNVNSNNSNLLKRTELESGSNNVFKSNSWVNVDEYGRMNNNNNRTYSDPQKKLEKGAEAFYGVPQPDNNNPFV